MYVCVIAKGSTKAVEPFAFSLLFSSPPPEILI